MFYTINISPMLVTKSVFKWIFVLSNYQTCTFPFNLRNHSCMNHLSDSNGFGCKFVQTILRRKGILSQNISFNQPLQYFSQNKFFWVIHFLSTFQSMTLHVCTIQRALSNWRNAQLRSQKVQLNMIGLRHDNKGVIVTAIIHL